MKKINNKEQFVKYCANKKNAGVSPGKHNNKKVVDECRNKCILCSKN